MPHNLRLMLEAGTSFGPYRIVALLGAGGMGEVYRAHDPRLNREVALKILRPEFADDGDRLQRFVREAQALAALNHPHIAQIHGVEDASSSTSGQVIRALVMEFVDGEDLSARLSRAPLPIDEALEIARQIAEALEAAHDQGIIHRDLKPANVKIRHDGTVKVLDFGLAKALTPGASSSSAASLANSPTFTSPAMTSANVILGTAAYMSPEQARGKPVDKRADIWSFGVVLYEMLARRPAYTGETVTDLIAAVVTRDPDWSAIPDDVPSSVRRLLRRCHEKDPRVRLRDIGEARVVLAKPGGADGAAAHRHDRPRGAGRILPWAVAVVALIVAAVALIPRPAPEPPTRKLEIAMPADAVASTVMLSPDGTRIAYRAGDRVVVTDLEKLSSGDVAVSKPSQRNALFWAPDSSFVGYNDVDGKLWVVPAAGGSPRLVCTIPESGQLMGAAWAASGTITLAVWRGSLYQVPAAGGEPTRLAAIDPKTDVDFHTPVVMPDGRVMVASHLLGQAGGGETVRVDMIGNQTRETAIGGGFVPVGYTASGHVLAHRRDANVGLWAFPYSGRLPLRVEDGFLIAPGAEFPTFADDGSILYSLVSAGQRSRELVWIDRTGQLIGQIGPEQSEVATPTLSPDGGRVAFAARRGANVNVWVRDLLGNTQTPVTFNATDQAWPTWFPSGKRLAYWEVGAIGLNRIAAANTDGSGGRQELANGEGPQVSPDGRFITYGVDDRGDTHLRYSTLSPEGEAGPATPVFRRHPEPSVHGVRFSPDGRYLVYGERQPGGALELFMTSFPSGEGRWPISRGGGRSPAWAANGELFFAEGSTDGPKSMMSVSVKTGTPPTVGTPSKLFTIGADIEVFPRGLSFDAARDGKRFVMIRSRRTSGSPSAMRWVLVQNWLSEFK